jgi:uncharacterized protein (TIGR02246 family)
MTDTTELSQMAANEAEILALITRWSKAVCNQDMAAIRAHHDPETLMFDVPPPLLSRGLDAYMATWDMFFACQAKPVHFNFRDLAITAGNDVAYATAIGRCRDLGSSEQVQLDFRLTMGLCKRDGQWRIMHEHHSVPATA